MRLLADEGVDAAIVARLRAGGHDLVYVAELAAAVVPSLSEVLGVLRARRAARI